MKVLHIVRQFYPCIGGMENFIYHLTKEQIRKGDKVSVLTLDKNFFDGSSLPKTEIYDSISITRIPFFGSKRYPIALSCIRYLGGYDIIHIHGVDFFVDYLVVLKPIHKKKILLHTHGGYFHTKFLWLFKKVHFNIITRIISHGCDKIIAVSDNDYSRFIKLNKNIAKIENGVDVEKFSKIEKRIERGSLLYIGRIDSHKRIDNLIKMAFLLINKGYKIKLKILGPDWKKLEPMLRAYALKLGIQDSVFFLGKVSDNKLLQELAVAHIFVSASEYEGFGISAIEAMASGTICVLNDIDSFRHFLKEKNCGIITDFNNSGEAASAIKNVLDMKDDEYKLLADNAKEISRQYSWNLIADKICSVYKEVLNK